MTNNHVKKPLMGTYKIKDMIVDIYFSPKVIETYASEEEIFKLCHYRNLQPLWASDNILKGCKIPNVQIQFKI